MVSNLPEHQMFHYKIVQFSYRVHSKHLIINLKSCEISMHEQQQHFLQIDLFEPLELC